MSMTRIGRPVAAGCGVLYPVLSIVGDDVIAGVDGVASDAGTPEQVLAAIADQDATFLVGRSIGMLAAVCLLVFAAYVATRVRAAAGPDSMFPLWLSALAGSRRLCTWSARSSRSPRSATTPLG